MKRLLLMTVVVLVLVFGLVGLASANGGPHGDYDATTDKCAGCHRAHTATGPMLLLESSTYDLCMSCHGSLGAGANTNVEDGLYDQTRDDAPHPDYNHGAALSNGESLLGGGFVNYLDVTDNAGQVAVTSYHMADNTVTDVWGGHTTISTTIGVTTALQAGTATPFDCVSCHDPHGNSNYRMLQTTVNGVGPIVVPQVDEAAKDYGDEQWDYTGDGMSEFCAGCHGAYHKTGAGSGSSVTDGFTHRIDMYWDAAYAGSDNPEEIGVWDATNLLTLTLPLADDFGTDDDEIVVCTTCHFAHGGTAAQGASSELATLDGDLTTGAVEDSSALLRLDNRGVCQVCHQK